MGEQKYMISMNVYPNLISAYICVLGSQGDWLLCYFISNRDIYKKINKKPVSQQIISKIWPKKRAVFIITSLFNCCLIMMLQRNFNPNIQINLSIFFFTNFKVKKEILKNSRANTFIFSVHGLSSTHWNLSQGLGTSNTSRDWLMWSTRVQRSEWVSHKMKKNCPNEESIMNKTYANFCFKRSLDLP